MSKLLNSPIFHYSLLEPLNEFLQSFRRHFIRYHLHLHDWQKQKKRFFFKDINRSKYEKCEAIIMMMKKRRRRRQRQIAKKKKKIRSPRLHASTHKVYTTSLTVWPFVCMALLVVIVVVLLRRLQFDLSSAQCCMRSKHSLISCNSLPLFDFSWFIHTNGAAFKHTKYGCIVTLMRPSYFRFVCTVPSARQWWANRIRNLSTSNSCVA